MMHGIGVEYSQVIMNKYYRFRNLTYEEIIYLKNYVENNLRLKDAINRSVRKYYNDWRY